MAQTKPNLNLEPQIQSGTFVSSEWTRELEVHLDEPMSTLFSGAFSVGYCDDHTPSEAIQDIALYEKLNETKTVQIGTDTSQEISMRLYKQADDADTVLRFRLMRTEQSIALSDVLPLLENFGLRVLGEKPYQLKLIDGQQCWLHVFEMEYKNGLPAGNVEELAALFEEAFMHVWEGVAENDLFNQLVFSGQHPWREVTMIRSYSRYMKQIALPFTRPNIANTLAKYPEITQQLVAIFDARYNPNLMADEHQRQVESELATQALESSFDAVSSLADDQILRQYLTLILATLRTNYYQTNDADQPHRYLSFKFDVSAIPEAPKPRPKYEIFVYSAALEGVHLRGGKVARGGLRWSDREEDFRTEVLGLVKAQQVKNAVIVPMGAKGGFFCKNAPSPSNREAWLANGVACYRDFISALIEVTDNLVDGVVVPPQAVVRWDDDDPYLVVAADKGTATFSDIANEISLAHGFWLGDAFASGGSVGYDHKVMGITAKGAWVSVQRHFREMGVNTQQQDFSVVAVGDMAGDVFGNGMLCSEHICLIAAFNHQHIFIDPNPDAASSYIERQRLFNTPGTNWEDYKKELISEGGGIFNRSDKAITLTSQMQERFGIEQNELTPNELIHMLLKAKVDLFWNGGIGTYAKASDETHTDVGDRANDVLRVNADELGALVIGEGGNLGITQLARVEYCLNGGRCNSDFIDNAAGVDCSDHEVNIKILLNALMAEGLLEPSSREELLHSMTDAVSDLVLENNYRQTQAISLAQAEASLRDVEYRRLISHYEANGVLDRELEFIPSDDVIAERKSHGKSLTRPELSIMVSYSKLALKSALVNSDIAKNDYIAKAAYLAFPELLRATNALQIDDHQLHNEIVATQLSGDVVNRMGITFVHRMEQATGESSATITKAYIACRDLFNLEAQWEKIEALDYAVSSDLQHQLFSQLIRLVRRSSRWLLREERSSLDPAQVVENFKSTAEFLQENISDYLFGDQLNAWHSKVQSYVNEGVPRDLAEFAAGARYFYTTFSIAEVLENTDATIEKVTELYFGLGEKLELNWFADQILQMHVESYWQAMARESFRDDLESHQCVLAQHIATTAQLDEPTELIFENWSQQYAPYIERWQEMMAELRCVADFDIAMFPVAIRELLDLSQASKAGDVNHYN